MNEDLGYKLVATLPDDAAFQVGYMSELLNWLGQKYPVIAEDLRYRIANRTPPPTARR